MADRHTTEKLLEGERLSGKVTLFAKVTILPNVINFSKEQKS